MKVCKFGGSSVASAPQILKVIDIVRRDTQRRVVVVSAPGKRDSGDTKITDLLISCAESVLAGLDANPALERIVERFAEISAALELPSELLDDLRTDLQSRLAADRSHAGKFMDCVKAAGEDLAARFVAAAFAARGVPARYVSPMEAGLKLTDEFGNAQLLPESYENIANHFTLIDELVVFPGFFGHTLAGDVVTFPRGGSDVTGAILAAALKAEVYENFTDVDSVYPVDPRIVPEVSEGIATMTYAEMRELSYAGFGVFHDEAVLPAIRASIPINIRNTNHPDAPGTMVVERRVPRPGCILGIASDGGFATFFSRKYLMNREVGFGRRLLEILEDEHISFEHSPSGMDSMSVVVREKGVTEEKRARIMERIRNELHVDEVLYESGLALVMVVGEGMRYTVGLMSRITGALAKAGINLEMINQGSSEISVMLGIRDLNRKAAVRALYREFFEEKA